LARRRIRRGQQDWSVWLKLAKLALVAGFICAAAFYAYEVGQRLAMEEIGGLRREIEKLTASETARKDEIATLGAELAAAKARADEFQGKYEQVAPSEEMKDILNVVRTKLASGLDAKRLAFVIAQAERPRRCGEVSTKRFMVKTATFDGEATWVRFADLITVTAQGVGGNNGAEQWFDPDKPISVTFTAIGGKESKIEGKLPLQHSVVLKNGEYRFTLVPSAKGFVEITGDRCEYRG
jgi:hypothetical protein